MPKIIKKKAQKQVTVQTEKDILEDVKEFYAARQRHVAYAGIAVIVVLALAVGIPAYLSMNKKKAEKLEYQGYLYLDKENLKTPISDEERFANAIQNFQMAYETEKSPYPLYYLAESYYESGDSDKAIETLEKLVKEFPDNEKYLPLAYYKLATIYGKAGDMDKALLALGSIRALRTNSMKDLAIAESAKILESQGKEDEAKKLYNIILTDFPDSPFTSLAKSKTKKEEAAGEGAAGAFGAPGGAGPQITIEPKPSAEK